MNTEQPLALKLADELEMWTLGEPAAAELRRLHAENIELAAKVRVAESGFHAAVQTAKWQESTIRELNRHIEKKAELRAENEALREALQGMLNIVNDSRGVAGYHLNGDTAEWDEFDEVDAAEAALARAGETK